MSMKSQNEYSIPFHSLGEKREKIIEVRKEERKKEKRKERVIRIQYHPSQERICGNGNGVQIPYDGDIKL